MSNEGIATESILQTSGSKVEVGNWSLRHSSNDELVIENIADGEKVSHAPFIYCFFISKSDILTPGLLTDLITPSHDRRPKPP